MQKVWGSMALWAISWLRLCYYRFLFVIEFEKRYSSNIYFKTQIISYFFWK